MDNNEEKNGVVLNQYTIISFVVPIIGFILYFYKMKKDKDLAKWILLWSIGGLIVDIMIFAL